jgi:hypothetical protein
MNKGGGAEKWALVADMEDTADTAILIAAVFITTALC